MALEKISNDIRAVRRDSAESSERDHRRSRGYNDDEKTERSEVALALSLDVIQGDGPWTHEQHSNQGQTASVHVHESVQQIVTDLMQRQPLGCVLLPTVPAIRLSEWNIGVAVLALVWHVVGHFHDGMYATSA